MQNGLGSKHPVKLEAKLANKSITLSLVGKLVEKAKKLKSICSFNFVYIYTALLESYSSRHCERMCLYVSAVAVVCVHASVYACMSLYVSVCMFACV